MKKIILFCLSLFVLNCQNPSTNSTLHKEQIIETLKNETKYFCERNLKEWQKQWSHKSFCSKMYAGRGEVAFEYFEGWESINQFTVQHIAENPEVIPIPKTNFEYDIHLFGETAWVFYSKNVAGKLVKETRYMLKEGSKWKIAKMQTLF